MDPELVYVRTLRKPYLGKMSKRRQGHVTLPRIKYRFRTGKQAGLSNVGIRISTQHGNPLLYHVQLIWFRRARLSFTQHSYPWGTRSRNCARFEPGTSGYEAMSRLWRDSRRVRGPVIFHALFTDNLRQFCGQILVTDKRFRKKYFVVAKCFSELYHGFDSPPRSLDNCAYAGFWSQEPLSTHEPQGIRCTRSWLKVRVALVLNRLVNFEVQIWRTERANQIQRTIFDQNEALSTSFVFTLREISLWSDVDFGY